MKTIFVCCYGRVFLKGIQVVDLAGAGLVVTLTRSIQVINDMHFRQLWQNFIILPLQMSLVEHNCRFNNSRYSYIQEQLQL